MMIIFCHYYLKEREVKSAVRYLLHIFGKDTFIIVVTNRGGLDGLRNQGVKVLRGSNSLFDFSAYKEGFYSRDISHDLTMFINETIFTKYPYKWVMKRIKQDLSIGCGLRIPMTIGISGEYDYFLTRNPWNFSTRHLCTACFVVNAYSAKILMELIDSVSQFFDKGKIQVSDGMLSNRLRAVFGDEFFSYLEAVLFSSSSVWKPGSEIIINDELSYKKGLCFYLEHRFSAETEMRGGGLIYINRGKNKAVFNILLFVRRRFAGFRFNSRRSK